MIDSLFKKYRTSHTYQQGLHDNTRQFEVQGSIQIFLGGDFLGVELPTFRLEDDHSTPSAAPISGVRTCYKTIPISVNQSILTFHNVDIYI